MQARYRRFKQSLARSVPWLGVPKRLVVAVADTLTQKASYAQHGEDVYGQAALADFDLATGCYVDVGANHPTDMSNSFAFYRSGARGIVVEPNPELVRLFRLVRPRDQVVPVACGEAPGLATFTISKTPVLSSLTKSNAGDVWKRLTVPVLRLDDIVGHLNPTWVPLLSVDVEGHSDDVLRGATATLEKTYVACVEAPEGTREEEGVLEVLQAANFRVVERIACNLLAVNQRPNRFDEFRRR